MTSSSNGENSDFQFFYKSSAPKNDLVLFISQSDHLSNKAYNVAWLQMVEYSVWYDDFPFLSVHRTTTRRSRWLAAGQLRFHLKLNISEGTTCARSVSVLQRQKHDEKYQKIERDCHQPPMIRVINLKLISSNCASLLARLGILIGERILGQPFADVPL